MSTMKKLIGIGVIAAVLALAACSGGTLTVAQYAKWCGDQNDQTQQVITPKNDTTVGEFRSVLNGMLDNYGGANPPEQMKDFHNAQMRFLRLFLDAADGYDEQDLLSDARDGMDIDELENVIELLTDEERLMLATLTPSERSELIATGCIG